MQCARPRSAAPADSNIVTLEDFRKPAVATWERPGYIHNRLSTWRETKEWRAIASQHEKARCRVNDLVAAGLGPDSEPYAGALLEYRKACGLVLTYKRAKPRHMPSMIRCAAELFGFQDPPWCRSGPKNSSETEILLGLIYSHAIAVGLNAAIERRGQLHNRPSRSSRRPSGLRSAPL